MAGVTLFVLVTLCWGLWFGYFEQRIGSSEPYVDIALLFAAGLSAVSVVLTGYLLGRKLPALWLGWVPGATFLAIGDPTSSLFFVGVYLLFFGWPAYFWPLIAIGAALRRRRVKRLPRLALSTHDQ